MGAQVVAVCEKRDASLTPVIKGLLKRTVNVKIIGESLLVVPADREKDKPGFWSHAD
jgi:hypothetical protein